MLTWMAWTAPTAGVFVGLFVLLTFIGLYTHYVPPVARRGFLGFATDVGDRLYIALITVALFLVVWLALTAVSVSIAAAVGLVIFGVVMRWA